MREANLRGYRLCPGMRRAEKVLAPYFYEVRKQRCRKYHRRNEFECAMLASLVYRVGTYR